MKNFIKKTLVTVAVVMAASLSITNLTPVSTSAEGFIPERTDVEDNCAYFLGMTSWDCGVEITDENSLKTGIWKIVANIATDLTVLAAYLIIGYVIYGGYLYIFSGGEPSKVATGKKALYQAFMGLAIVMSANIIMNSIRIALVGGDSGNLQNCISETGCVGGDPSLMIENAIQWVIGIAGVIAAIFVVYGGISYTTSSGDPSKVQSAKRMIIYSLIGLVIVAIAEIITSFVATTIRNANNASSTPTTSLVINQTILTKETHEN